MRVERKERAIDREWRRRAREKRKSYRYRVERGRAIERERVCVERE